VLSIFSGTLALVKIPITAMGSVGEISAPNNKQYINSNSTDNKLATTYNSPAIINVEAKTPNMAKIEIAFKLFFYI